MYYHKKKPWNIPERTVTSETAYFSRRSLIGGSLALALTGFAPSLALAQSSKSLDATKNSQYDKTDRPLTSENAATSYNNFYEFGSHKSIAPAAQKLETEPWKIKIDGLVEKDIQLDLDDLITSGTLEERIYRLRCVETWAMVVPWIGFPMTSLIAKAKPLNSAKYVLMETDTQDNMVGLQQSWYPWPYTEAVSIEEANNDLAFLVVGLYGKRIPPQNGAPIRLALPWKYGFKSVKSIKRFSFVDKMPQTFWTKVAGNEYGFWANINPDVPHRRWSQKTEKMLETNEVFNTEIFNGYGDSVAHLYKDRLNDPAIFF